MSARAEGCGQWLSTKDRLPQQACKKGKQKDGLKRLRQTLASRSKHSFNINIVFSSSPLSPGTKRKVENAKQSKIDRFFQPSTRSNHAKCAEKAKPEQSIADLKNKIQTTRHQEDSKHDCGPWSKLDDEQETDEYNEQNFNVSGVSFLSYSSEENDVHPCGDIHKLPLQDENSPNQHSSSPPIKKFRYAEGVTMPLENGIELPIPMTENVQSQAFSFTQWAKEEVAKCKQIQDEDTFDNSLDFCSTLGCHDDCTALSDSGHSRNELYETPPFEFTQWAKEQVKICQEIQAESDSPHVASFPSIQNECQDLQGMEEKRKRSRSKCNS